MSTARPSNTVKSGRAVKIIDLQPGESFAFDAGAGRPVPVLYGRIWLSEPGRCDELFAASGDEISLSKGGRLLVEAVGFASVAVPSVAQRPARSLLGCFRLASMSRHAGLLPRPRPQTP